MIEIGAKVHLGFAVKGGAGYVGILRSYENGQAVLEIPGGVFGPRTILGPVQNLSLA